MIKSAKEFINLRMSEVQSHYSRTVYEEAPDEIWIQLIDQHPEMREWVAYNETIKEPIMRRLANDLHSKIRLMIAAKQRLPLDLLETFSHDPENSVRLTVAIHPDTPAHVLQAMINDPSEPIREVVQSKIKSTSIH